MQDIISLVDDHDRLSADARNLTELATSSAPRPEEAFDALTAFRCALNAHLTSEGQFLTGADQIGRIEFSAFAAEQNVRFSDLTEEWDVYLSEWSEENMREDWARTGRASHARPSGSWAVCAIISAWKMTCCTRSPSGMG